MKRYFLLGLLAASAVCGFSYAGDATDQKIHEDQAQLKADYQKKINLDLNKLGRKIKHLQHKTDAQMNAELEKQNEKLAAKKAEADRKLAELGKSSGSAWQDLRKGMDKALADLKASVDAASKQFKASSTPSVK